MKRFAYAALAASALCAPAYAQERDSVFTNYADYEAYIDKHIMARNFVPMVKALGGRDEYTPEQLAQVNRQLMGAFPVNFQNKTVYRKEDLGGGLSQEGRAYWTGESYAFFYAILHDRGDDLVVLQFALNSSASVINGKF